ncbi:hypothetical protein HYH02_010263 [Chlamydomonas schloesseri]|uniref:ABC transporter domain-containing protein n=1 Tax=Chlamydomonas schloesseri TaxID=2026947 RepID=A0A835W803_9CHLO|nr:hypothetical protein HYH02_010263 [Chlamydomonas schloesseri]|eukprot:KAG2440684.1 hypothetical protein HYH02_010263 [Chlamydomonas schloesseri]
MKSGLSPTVCAPCTRCTADSLATDPAGCAAACPAGPLAAVLGAAPAGGYDRDQVAAVTYWSFALAPWREAGYNRTMVKATELVALLSNETYLSKPVNTSFDYNTTYMREAVRSVYATAQLPITAAAVPLAAVADTFAAGSRATLCPKVNSSAPADALPRITGPGCACNLTSDPASFRCPSGYRCSRSGYLALSTDVLTDPTWAALGGACVPCDAGQYCAEGVYVKPTQEGARLKRDLDCPAGSYCPSPGHIITCPAGYYCGRRAQFKTTCNYSDLISTPEALIPQDGEADIITRLKRNREPIRGNYCPEGSSKPSVVCAGGYYCPNATTQIICPVGYYCKPQSIYPVKCPPVVACPEGTESPDGRPLAGLIFAFIVVGMYLLYWVTELGMWVGERIIRHLSLVQRLRNGLATLGHVAGIGAEETDAQRQMEAEQEAKRQRKEVGFDIATMKSSPWWKLEENTNIRFRDVRGRMPKGKDKGGQLEGITGFFEAGKLSAIMGPSGCGKTTLILVLSGRMPAAVSVFNDEHETVALTETRYRRKLGFVPQDDILHADLTVRENLEYSARLKLPRSMPRVERHGIIDDTLRMLGMYDKQDRLTGSVENKVISGGERKRVSIGVEIVGKPPILFMDEPTSGLDAARSSELCTLMSNLAAASKTNIIAVIHQPRYSSFILFDKLMLLAPGGKMLFQGPPTLCVPYFRILGFHFPAEENHADTLLDVVAEPKMTSDRGIRVEELPIVWHSKGEAWLHRFSNPVERFRRAVQAMLLSNRMTRIAKSALRPQGTGATNVTSNPAETKAIASAVGEAKRPVKLLPDWSTKKNKPERDALKTGSPERNEWLAVKLTKLFPKHEEEGRAMEKQRQALEGYERGFHSETSSTPTEFSNPDTISESGSSEDIGKILLLKYPNKGDNMKDELAKSRADHINNCDPRKWFKGWKEGFIWEMVQLKWLIHRNLVKSTRAFWPGTVVDVLLLQGAAFIVGVIQGSKWGLSAVPSNVVMAYLVLSVLSTVTHLRTFTTFRTVQLRERMSGVSVFATFFASNITDLGWIFLSPAVYFAIYYFVTMPRNSFDYFYVIGFLVCWYSSGLAYVISVSSIPQQAQLITAVILTLILGAFLHGMSPTIRSGRGTFLEVVLGISYNRWAMEASTIGEFRKYFEYKSNEIIMIYYGIGLCDMDTTLIDDGNDSLSVEEALSFVTLQRDFDENYCNNSASTACIILFCMGLGFRLIGFAQMLYQSHEQYFQILRERLWHEFDDLTKVGVVIDWLDHKRKAIVSFAQNLYANHLRTIAASAGSNLKGGIGTVASKAGAGLSTAVKGAASGVKTVGSGMRSGVSTVGSGVRSGVTSMGTGMRSGLSSAASGIGGLVGREGSSSSKAAAVSPAGSMQRAGSSNAAVPPEVAAPPSRTGTGAGTSRFAPSGPRLSSNGVAPIGSNGGAPAGSANNV